MAQSFTSLSGAKLGITNLMPLRSGFKIPQLGFGTYRLSGDEAGAAVAYALECGFRHIDCAKAYMNEREIGTSLRHTLKVRSIKREDVFITSKLWSTDQRPDLVEAACRKTLADLQLDYLDLYLVHWPVCWRNTGRFDREEDIYPKDADGLAAVEKDVTLLDTWKAMSALVDKGLVRSIGVSNCSSEQINALADAIDLHFPVLNQVELHPCHVDRALISTHNFHQMLTAAYCPLGMPTPFASPECVPVVKDEAIQKLSALTGYSPERLILNWSLDLNNVVIVKSAKKENIKANAKAARFTLQDQVRVVLDHYSEVVRRYRVVNPTNFTKLGKPYFDDGEGQAKQQQKQ